MVPFAGGMLVTCYDNGTYVKITAGGKAGEAWDQDSTGHLWLARTTRHRTAMVAPYLTASGPWESSSARSITSPPAAR